MQYAITTGTKKITNLQKRIRAIQGGSSASKTISILLFLISDAERDKEPTVTSIVSESLPHLKRGAMRDFLNIMEGHGHFDRKRWDKTNSIYTFESGSIIEFFGVENFEKVKGGRRERLFINEANNVSFEVFTQMEIRTNEYIFLDWNPSNEFWFYTELLGKRDDLDHIILTYKDNEALKIDIVRTLEARMNNKSWWKVYGLGQLGEVEGNIYKDWQFLDEVPFEARLERRGLDFGYTNDPSALIDIYRYNNGYVLDEQIYQFGMSNKEIADQIKLLSEPRILVLADSAEPKSIDELKGYGLNVMPAPKGAGSVHQRIQFIQSCKIYVTKRSVNLIKEYRNYLWMVDKDGKVLNEPIDMYNHCLDAVRYGLTSYRPQILLDGIEMMKRLQEKARNTRNYAR